MRTISLRQAIHENRQRQKYRRVLTRLRLRFFDYQDAGFLAFAKYLHVVEKVTYRLYELRKERTR